MPGRTNAPVSLVMWTLSGELQMSSSPWQRCKMYVGGLITLTSMNPGAGEEHLSHIYQRTVSLFSETMPHTFDAPQICCLLLSSPSHFRSLLSVSFHLGWGIHLQASRSALMPNGLCLPSFSSYIPPLWAFLSSCSFIFSSSGGFFVQLWRISDEDIEDRFNAANLKMHPPPSPSCIHAPYRLRKHEIVSFSHAHTPPSIPMHE